MPVESMHDFIEKLNKKVVAENQSVQTEPKQVIVTEDTLPAPISLKEFKRVKPEVTTAPVAKEIDKKRDLQVKADGIAGLKTLAFEGFLNFMTSQLRGNEDAIVKKVETDFEGRENMAVLEVWDEKTKIREPDVIWKNQREEGDDGVKRIYNDSASSRIAKKLRLRVVSERTWIPPKQVA